MNSVFATAIGRYLIRDKDPNARNSKHHSKPESLGVRTLFNSTVKDWSWPCVSGLCEKMVDAFDTEEASGVRV